MQRTDLSVYLSVISAHRPSNVFALTALVGKATWYVPQDEVAAYQDAGAEHVVGSGLLCVSRNQALRDAWEQGVPCMQVSDDLRATHFAFPLSDGKIGKRAISFSEAAHHVTNHMRAQSDAYYGGAAPTANAFFFSPARPVSSAHFIVGDFIVVKPCELFFDELLVLKEDYDYTMQHLSRYGHVVRCNELLMTFRHRTNQGGAISIRTPLREQEAIFYLKRKWGDAIRSNPRRENEVLLKWRAS